MSICTKQRVACCSNAWLVVVLFALSLPGVGASQTELPAGAKNLRSLDLPVPAPALLPSPDGKYLVCVQWMPAGFTWRTATTTTSQVQVVIVDLEQMATVGRRDVPSSPATNEEERRLRVATGNKEVYFHDGETLHVWALPDMTNKLSVPLSAIPSRDGEFLVVAGKFLATPRGKSRLDLPGLTPSEQWRNPEDKSTVAVHRVESSWYVDGILYDESLGRPLMAFPPGDSTWISRMKNPWPGDIGSGNAMFNQATSLERPLAVRAVEARRRAAGMEAPFEILLVGRGEKTLAKTSAIFPATYSIGNRLSWGQSEAGLRENPLVLGGNWPEGSGQSHWLLPMATVGRQFFFVVDGRLSVWTVDPDLVLPSEGAFRFVLRQPALEVDPSAPIVLKHEFLSGAATAWRASSINGCVSVQNDEVVFDPTVVASPQGLQKLLNQNRFARVTRESIDAHRAAVAPFVRRLLGRESAGYPHLEVVTVAASDAGRRVSDELRYVVLVDIPAATLDAAFQAHEQEIARQTAQMKIARAEREAVERAEHQKRFESTQAEVAKGDIRRKLPYRVGGGVLLAALFALPLVVWGLFAPRPRGWLAQRGPLTALLGLVIFLVLLLFAPLFGMQLANPGWRAIVVDGGLTVALALLILLVSGGSAVTARDRGASVVTTLWLAVNPLGIILAMRADDPEA